MSDGKLMGKVVLRMNIKTEEYSIESSIKEEIQNIVFFLYMIDKFLVDCTDPKAAQAILANAVALVLRQGKVYSEIQNVYKRFRKLPLLTSHEFEIECNLLSKSLSSGEHFYALTNYKPFMTQNINGKTVVLSSLYTINLQNSFSSELVEVLDIAIKLLYEEYGRGAAMPKISTITHGPSAVVNKMFPKRV